MIKNIFNTVKNFRASASCSKILNGENIFNTVYSVYIHLGVIRVIWGSVVCNLDQSQTLRYGTVAFNHCVAPSKSRTYLHQ